MRQRQRQGAKHINYFRVSMQPCKKRLPRWAVLPALSPPLPPPNQRRQFRRSVLPVDKTEQSAAGVRHASPASAPLNAYSSIVNGSTQHAQFAFSAASSCGGAPSAQSVGAQSDAATSMPTCCTQKHQVLNANAPSVPLCFARTYTNATVAWPRCVRLTAARSISMRTWKHLTRRSSRSSEIRSAPSAPR